MSDSLRKDADNSSNEAPASIPQTTPKGIGYGHPEFQFIQSIMEMQKSLGEINSSIQALNKTVDSTKSKVDELVKWKHMIVGGAIVIGVILGATVTIGTKIFGNGSFDPIRPQSMQPTQSNQPEQK